MKKEISEVIELLKISKRYLPRAAQDGLDELLDYVDELQEDDARNQRKLSEALAPVGDGVLLPDPTNENVTIETAYNGGAFMLFGNADGCIFLPVGYYIAKAQS